MNRRVFAAALVGLTLGVSGARADAPMSIAGATTVDAKAIIALMESKPDLVIIDNRRAEDYANGFIEGAVRVLDTDLTEAVLASHVKTKATPVLFYCNGVKCGRAAKATEMAVRWGYTQVHYYALGMEEWRALGLPVAGP
ncbi:rhodanese-like domain-containing protein [Elioraea tepidiphila]|jgi:rhodanese-related sulfurtransferase|uniref:rhodanese-like domain-containing protein n=1 Tax=Elioraea tepidiphila TaxID=457934 RepID=UPI00036F5832|nr:rhodanese-like domain-containing protein [Elioraea tepidiphila]